jgi:sugar O-acyltransferase (sialic acid O-acetyltransferase NeuD family)
MTITEILMPQLGVNDDLVKVHKWIVERGRKVSAGEEIAELETTKATFALEAEASGYLYPIVEGGQEVPVRSVLGLLLDQPDDAAVAKFVTEWHESQAVTSESHSTNERRLQLTAKARALIEKHSVDVSSLPLSRIIRERDVLELLEKERAVPLRCDPTRVVAVYGASQGGITMVDTIRAMGGLEVVAFIDDTPHLIGTSVFGLPVWSGQELESLSNRGIGALASHIAVRDFRLKIRDRAAAAGLTMLNVIHPRAYISPSVKLGVGNVIKAGAIVDTDAQLGDCCIIDNGVVVPHHNVVHDACHLAPGVVMGGGCSIGERTLLGVGTRVSSRIQIGHNVIVSPGSVVVNDVGDDVLIGGHPAKVMGKRR